MLIITKCGILERGENHDELADNSSKTSMNPEAGFFKFPVMFPVLRESTVAGSDRP
jgi:hypothetical protein